MRRVREEKGLCADAALLAESPPVLNQAGSLTGTPVANQSYLGFSTWYVKKAIVFHGRGKVESQSPAEVEALDSTVRDRPSYVCRKLPSAIITLPLNHHCRRIYCGTGAPGWYELSGEKVPNQVLSGLRVLTR